MLHKCKNHSRRACVRCLVFTLSFPIEHLIWEKAPLFRLLTSLMGL